ncbi:MAG: conserved membrane protein of unknown function [Promethearchaeota archaeon]|jgi:hypothetical protein|nr:MAG: conserved membrane protein of unknown function [Candidatus Lokiarchaeota archaeon]
MSKFKKKRGGEEKEDGGYRTVIFTAIITGVLFIASLLFNGEIISLTFPNNIIFELVKIVIRTILILLFFLFFTISYANYRDLVGKPIGWKELLFLLILSMIQSILNVYVFVLSLLGLILILLYLYLIQE